MKHTTVRMLALLLAVALCLPMIPAAGAAGGTVSITIPAFPVSLNGRSYNSSLSQYPLIVYNQITYFPMTYESARWLGLGTSWSGTAGLGVYVDPAASPVFSDYQTASYNPAYDTASIADFPIHVNGKPVNNAAEQYPLLLYRSVTYFPMTWAFCVDEFHWDYYFTSGTGLSITSDGTPATANGSRSVFEFVMQRLAEASAFEDGWYFQQGNCDWNDTIIGNSSRWGGPNTLFLRVLGANSIAEMRAATRKYFTAEATELLLAQEDLIERNGKLYMARHQGFGGDSPHDNAITITVESGPAYSLSMQYSSSYMLPASKTCRLIYENGNWVWNSRGLYWDAAVYSAAVLPEGDAELTAVVTDSRTGAPISSANLTLWSNEGYRQALYTDANGYLGVKNLPAGRYYFSMDKAGYTGHSGEGHLMYDYVDVQAGNLYYLPLKLYPSA